MSDSSILTAERREKVGTRASREVRSAGRIPASLQADGNSPHVDISIDEREFLAFRRQHVNLYDIDVDGDLSSAIVRELQWDAFGDNIIHVEFRRVQRGVEIESVVALSTAGQANGVVNLLVSQIAIRSIPSKIPDGLVISVKGLEEGTHLTAAEIEMPEGVSLAIDGETEVVTISGMKEEVEESTAAAAEGEEGAEPAAGDDAEDAGGDGGDAGGDSDG
ncbi:MAG: 50S ribosomal protein L25 [Planctomycetes bacterium]|nr:50S ribosomal protein L25 [Planctomycetota bacterium]